MFETPEGAAVKPHARFQLIQQFYQKYFNRFCHLTVLKQGRVHKGATPKRSNGIGVLIESGAKIMELRDFDWSEDFSKVGSCVFFSLRERSIPLHHEHN